MKRIISLILLIVFISTLLVSCASEEKMPAEEKNQTENQPEEILSEEADTEPQLPVLPIEDFNGETVTFVNPPYGWGYGQIIAEEEDGEPINDAIYRRNVKIEEFYNVTIAENQRTGVLDFVQRSEKAGMSDYDVIITSLFDQPKLAQAGLLLDVNTMPHIDMSQPYWDAAIKRDLSIVGKTFFMAGDIHMHANDATWIMRFNKDLHQNLNLPDVYSLVLDGKWTLDALMDMIKGVSFDLNGDGQMSWEDRFGFATHNSTIDAFLSSANIQIFTKEDESTIKMDITSEKFAGMFTKIVSLFNDDYMTMNSHNHTKYGFPSYTGDLGGRIQALFENERALFVAEVTDVITRFRETDPNFGIVPCPKYDEKQESYYSPVTPYASVLSLPISCRNPEMIGLILEVMAAESRDTLRMAYYDLTLQRKRARDEESESMLDIIFENRIYPLGACYNWGGIVDALYAEVNKNSTGLQALADKMEGRVESAINRALDAYLSVE